MLAQELGIRLWEIYGKFHGKCCGHELVTPKSSLCFTGIQDHPLNGEDSVLSTSTRGSKRKKKISPKPCDWQRNVVWLATHPVKVQVSSFLPTYLRQMPRCWTSGHSLYAGPTALSTTESNTTWPQNCTPHPHFRQVSTKTSCSSTHVVPPASPQPGNQSAGLPGQLVCFCLEVGCTHTATSSPDEKLENSS